MQFGVHLPQIGWPDQELAGPTALATVLAAAPTVRMMTSVSLPVVLGPFAERWARFDEAVGPPMRDEVEQLERVAAEFVPHLS